MQVNMSTKLASKFKTTRRLPRHKPTISFVNETALDTHISAMFLQNNIDYSTPIQTQTQVGKQFRQNEVRTGVQVLMFKYVHQSTREWLQTKTEHQAYIQSQMNSLSTLKF